MSWVVLALLSAVFAALTAIFAKIGTKDVDSNLATAIRTVVILCFAWGVVYMQGSLKGLNTISRNTLFFLILSGVTTAISWLFYFKALQIGNVSKVGPIDKLSIIITIILSALILKEKVSLLVIVGGILMSVGAVLIVL